MQPSQFLFNEKQVVSEEKRPLIIIDKQAFERTLESFDKPKKAGKTDEHCLTEIQKEKQKLITQIQEDISEIENNIDNEGESEEQDTSILKESGSSAVWHVNLVAGSKLVL